MPFVQLKEFKKSIHKNNKNFLQNYIATEKPSPISYKIGEHIDSLTLKENHLLYIVEGYVVRYVNDSEGNQQVINLSVPNDILGTVTSFNKVRIPGGSRVVQKVKGIFIPADRFVEQNYKLLYDNLQYDLLYANATLQMNNMTKKQKIFFIMIELLRQNHLSSIDGLIFPKYMTQELIAEFTSSTPGYVSKVISELITEQILQKTENQLVCLQPDELLNLSNSHRAFSSDELFQ